MQTVSVFPCFVDMELTKHYLIDLIKTYAPPFILALVTLVVGLWLISRVTRVVFKRLSKRDYDPTVLKFIQSLVSVGLKVLLFVSVASMVGISTTSFVAVLGAAGLAVGLALQGSLSNFAGGVLILTFKPYQVGDFIEAQGVSGTVKEIQIFNTILITPQKQRIILPNGAVSNGTITNYSVEGIARADVAVGIGYDDDIEKAKSLVMNILENHPKVLKDPAPSVVLTELADSSLNLAVRPFTLTADKWAVHEEVMIAIKKSFDENGIEIPFPQTDVHYKNDGDPSS
jgi:small conductance mechanosensitive channel